MVEHLEELLSLLDLDRLFSALVVQDAGGMIGRVFFGPVDRAFRNAVELALKLYAHRVEQQYDLAIAEVRPPLDKNLYQAQKALENCQAAVADGGAVVIVSPCDEGVGSEHFFKLASRWDRRSNQPVDGVTRFGSHKLSRVNAIGKRIDVRLFSNLPPETVRQVFYEPVQDISSLISERAEKRHPLRLAVVHDAGHTVLQI